MKVIILSDAEKFCKDHNLNSIGIDTLRSMAISNDEKGLNIAYSAGYGKCSTAVIEAMAGNRP